MTIPAPHFLLYAEAAPRPEPSFSAKAESDGDSGGRWRFVLRLPGGETSLEATDDEPEATPDRLELLAVVRGLEALNQPSRVTLVTGSRSLRRGLDYGLSQWRENDWQWERYGRMTPVKNGDLWRRLDRLLTIHALECGPARLEQASDLAPPPATSETPPPIRRQGRAIRFDAPHTATKDERPPLRGSARNHKAQTISNSKARNYRSLARAPSGKLGIWNLFGHWSLVLGHWISLLAHRLQTPGKES
jgi:ribonuclease HI